MATPESCDEAVTRRVATSPDDMDDPLVAARMSPMVLPSGRFWAEWTAVDLGHGLVAETTEFSPAYVADGEVREGVITVGVPLRVEADRFNGAIAVPGALYVYGSTTEVMNSSAGHGRYGVVSFPAHALDESARRLGVDLDLPDRGTFEVFLARESDELGALLADVTAIGRAGSCSLDPHVQRAIHDELVEILSCSLQAEDRHPDRRLVHGRDMTRIVRACAEYAADVHYQGVMLADLSDVAGVGERQVRAAFSSVFGISPRAYLRLAALSEVRKVLVQAPVTPDPVSRAATEFGFWHLGRFAGQYRAQFGESPHDTVSAARRACPVQERAVNHRGLA